MSRGVTSDILYENDLKTLVFRHGQVIVVFWKSEDCDSLVNRVEILPVVVYGLKPTNPGLRPNRTTICASMGWS